MAVKDGVFIVSFFASYLLGLFYIMAFTSTYWTSYTLYIGGHKEIGSIGLWKKCSTNETSGVESCTSSRLAQGPSFLEVSRTMASIGLVFVVVGMLSYWVSNKQRDVKGCLDTMRYRIQEITYMQAGIFGLNSGSSYIANYKKHYKEHLDTTDVDIGAMSIVLTATGVLLLFNSIVLWYTRYCPCCKKGAISPRGDKGNEEKQQPLDRPSTQMTHGKGDQDPQTDEVTVSKQSWFSEVVAPNQIILAFKRLKNGDKRPIGTSEAGSLTLLDEDRAHPQTDPQQTKNMDIFTVSDEKILKK